jgi:hypothetical protein
MAKGPITKEKADQVLANMRRDRTTHGTAGRVNVERKGESINLRLGQWAMSPDCWLSFAEAKKLIEQIQLAMKPARTAIVAEDNYDDIA